MSLYLRVVEGRGSWYHVSMTFNCAVVTSGVSPVSGTSVGLMILLICSMLCRSGLSPPWQQKIFSSTIAAMGRQLKQSVNVFHSLILYLLLPEYHWLIRDQWYSCWSYIHHKIRRFCWWKHTRGFLATGRSSQDTWSCKPAADRWSPDSVYLRI